MSTASNTCEIPEEIKEVFRKFKLSNKENAAIIMKINKDKLLVEIEESIDNCSVEMLQNSLPESAPRYLAYSYKYSHPDGRVSFPLVFIYYCPREINPTLSMLYSSTKTRLMNATQITKTFDIQEADSLTEEWLKEKLKFFK